MALSAANARNEVMAGLAGGSDRVVIDKASMSNAVAGQMMSLWRAIGVPGQGAIPTTAAVCTKALVGAMGFTNQTSPVASYLLAQHANGMTGLHTWAACQAPLPLRKVHSPLLVCPLTASVLLTTAMFSGHWSGMRTRALLHPTQLSTSRTTMTPLATLQ